MVVKEPLSFALQVYIDFGFAQCMSDKEISKLVRQMCRVWGLQKKFVFSRFLKCFTQTSLWKGAFLI